MNKRSINNNLQGVLGTSNASNAVYGKYEDCSKHATIVVNTEIEQLTHTPNYTIKIYHSNSNTNDTSVIEEDVIPGVPISVKMNYFKISITNNDTINLSYKIETNLMKDTHAVYMYPNTDLSLRQLQKEGKCFSICTPNIQHTKNRANTTMFTDPLYLILNNSSNKTIYVYNSNVTSSINIINMKNRMVAKYYLYKDDIGSYGENYNTNINYNNIPFIRIPPTNLNQDFTNNNTGVTLNLSTTEPKPLEDSNKLEDVILNLNETTNHTLEFNEMIELHNGNSIVVILKPEDQTVGATIYNGIWSNLSFRFYTE